MFSFLPRCFHSHTGFVNKSQIQVRHWEVKCFFYFYFSQRHSKSRNWTFKANGYRFTFKFWQEKALLLEGPQRIPVAMRILWETDILGNMHFFLWYQRQLRHLPIAGTSSTRLDSAQNCHDISNATHTQQPNRGTSAFDPGMVFWVAVIIKK